MWVPEMKEAASDTRKKIPEAAPVTNTVFGPSILQVSIVVVCVLSLRVTEPHLLQLGESARHAWGQYDARNQMIG